MITGLTKHLMFHIRWITVVIIIISVLIIIITCLILFFYYFILIIIIIIALYIACLYTYWLRTVCCLRKFIP
jgi:hypothetical protein